VVLLVVLTGLGLVTVYQQIEVIRKGYRFSKLEAERERQLKENRILKFYHARYSSQEELEKRIEHFKLDLIPPEEFRAGRKEEEASRARESVEKPPGETETID